MSIAQTSAAQASVAAAADPVVRAPPGVDRGSDPLTEDLVEAFLAVMHHLGRHYFQRSAEFDLSPQLAKAFHELREPLSMGELAERLFCDASNVTGIVDRLESRGLVERQADPDDRRVKRLVLTKAGRDLWQAHHDRVYEDAPVFAELGPGEQADLLRLLRQAAPTPQPDLGAPATVSVVESPKNADGAQS